MVELVDIRLDPKQLLEVQKWGYPIEKEDMRAPKKWNFPPKKLDFPQQLWDVLLKIWIFPPPKLHSFQSSTNGVRNDHQGFQPDRPMGPTGPQKWRTTLSPAQLTEQYIYMYINAI